VAEVADSDLLGPGEDQRDLVGGASPGPVVEVSVEAHVDVDCPQGASTSLGSKFVAEVWQMGCETVDDLAA